VFIVFLKPERERAPEGEVKRSKVARAAHNQEKTSLYRLIFYLCHLFASFVHLAQFDNLKAFNNFGILPYWKNALSVLVFGYGQRKRLFRDIPNITKNAPMRCGLKRVCGQALPLAKMNAHAGVPNAKLTKPMH